MPVRAAPASATLAILLAAVLFGSSGTAHELGPVAATPVGVGTLRILIGGGTLWLLAGRTPRARVLVRHWRPIALGAAGVAVYQPAFFTGVDRMGVALGTIVTLGSGPVFAGLIVWAAGRRPSVTWAAATACAITGGALVVFAGSSGADLDAVGMAAALGSGLGYATYAVATKRLIIAGVESTEASAWQFSLGALALSPLLLGEPLGWVASGPGLALVLHLGVLTTGVAYLLYGWGLRSVGTSTATTLTLAEPVTAAVLAVAVLDERLRWFGWLGAVIVVVGLALTGGGARTQPWRKVASRWSR